MNIASVIQGAATLAWVVTGGLIVMAVINAGRGRPLKRASSLVIGMVVIAIVLSIVGAGLVFLRPDERGVVESPYVSQGYRSQIMGPGLHWIIPGENVKRYSISKQTYTMSIAADEGDIYGDDSVAARTADGQEIYVDASVIFQIDPDKIIDVHITWQTRYEMELVRPQVRGTIRDAVSQFGVEEVVSSQRFALVEDITEALRLKLEENGLILADFVMRNIAFSDEYAYSVEQKQIAEQLALQARFIVEQKRQEAEQARQVAQGQADAAVIAAQGEAAAVLARAEGQAEAWALLAEVLRNNPSLLTYEYIQRIAPNIEVMYLPSGTPLVLPLP